MRKLPLVFAFAFIFAGTGFGQPYTIQTFAGRGSGPRTALSASLSSISGVAVDRTGNVYISLREQAVVAKIDTAGILTVIAGSGVPGNSGDNGPATLAHLNSPELLAVDADGTVYISDAGAFTVRKVSNGVITTVATATLAGGLAADSGNLYIAALGKILKVSNGVTTTVAGGGGAPALDNGPAVGVLLSPVGLAVDAAGSLYIADSCLNRIRKVSNGTISTVAGNGTLTGSGFFPSCAPLGVGGDGRATNIALRPLSGVAVDAAGNVYFVEVDNRVGSLVRKVSNGNLSTVAGGGVCQNPFNCSAFVDNIPATSAALLPFFNSVAVDNAGNLFIPDGFQRAQEIGRLRKVSNGAITTVAGAVGISGDDGPATNAQLNLPAGLALDPVGNLFISDSANNVIREVSGGVITTIVGSKRTGFTPAGSSLYRPRGVALDPARGLYVVDVGGLNRVINGSLSLLISASDLRGLIVGLALDPAGNLYLADSSGNRILKVSNAGTTTEAGQGTFGFTGDGGPAISAQLAAPSGVAVDNDGNLYITDLGNQRIRKVSKGVITTVAGTGVTGFGGDNGPATSAQLNLPPSPCQDTHCDWQVPAGIAVDAAGDLYFADSGNQRIRRISNGVITTIAGNGTPGFSGDDGPANAAQFNIPSAIAIDAAGKVYVADSANNRVRVLIPSCTFSVNPAALQSGIAGGDFSLSIQTGPSCPWRITGLPNWIVLPAPPPVAGSGNVVLRVAVNQGPERAATLLIGGVTVRITQAGSATPGPFVTSVENAFGHSTTVAPNTWVVIKGSNLAPVGYVRTWQDADFVNGKMPTALNDVSVQMNGKNAYIYYISPEQINVLTPLDLPLGPLQVIVKVLDTASPIFASQSQPISPSLFTYDQFQYVVAVHADSTLVGPRSLFPGLTTPAKPGESIVLFANGFGGVSNPLAVGSVVQTGALLAVPVVRIGGFGAEVRFAGIVSPGLFQFNIVVPPSVPDGDNAIVVTYNGSATQPGTLLTIQK